MKEINQKLNLDRPATYQVRVPGLLNDQWSNWNEEIMVLVENDDDGMPITTMTGTLDQAALQGLLRRLYSLGVPLISVQWVD